MVDRDHLTMYVRSFQQGKATIDIDLIYGIAGIGSGFFGRE